MKKEAAYRRLVSYGLTPTIVAQLVAEVTKWVDRSGEEWTVSRLKEIRKHFQMRAAGCAYSPEWVALGPDGLPRGPFRRLYLLGRKGFVLAYNALMYYSGFSYRGDLLITSKQAKKFFTAVRRPLLDLPAVALESEIVSRSPLYVDVRKCNYDPIPLVEYPFSPSRRAPYALSGGGAALDAAGDVSLVLAFQNEVTEEFKDLYAQVLGRKPNSRGQYRLPISKFHSKFGWFNEGDKAYSGRISFLQEPGYKLRSVANPFVIQQAALFGLGHSLFSLFRQVPEDCVFDQSKGASQVQAWLNEGYTVHCADLSSATDNLPLSGQLDWLIRMGVSRHHLGLFEKISRGFWRIDSSERLPEGSEAYLSRYYSFKGVEWTVGQPLGLLPSYPSAFLYHHAIMYWCYQETGEPRRYVMVGDDVAMVGDKTYRLYTQVLNELGVPVQPTKCLSSARAAEFVGRFITKTSEVVSPKWRGDPSDASFIDLAMMLTVPRIYGLLRARQKRVLRYVAPIPEPWGLGFNPEGRSWEDRYLPWADVLDAEVERVRRFDASSWKTRRLARGDRSDSHFAMRSYLFDLAESPDPAIDAPGVLPIMARTLGAHLVVPNLCALDEQDGRASRLDRAVRSVLASVEKTRDVPALVQWERRKARTHGPVVRNRRLTRHS